MCRNLYRILFLCLALCGGEQQEATAQPDTMRVLFLGNSYTSYNNLSTLVRDLAASQNHIALVDQHVPGGQTLNGHKSDAITLQKIALGHWDAVVLQEQSQIPTIAHFRDSWMYPSARQLAAIIRRDQPCARLVLYLTWGRQFGGQQCDPSGVHCSPVFTDFGHMQDSLTQSYLYVAEDNEARLAPVGEAWRHVLDGGGLVLHQSDRSHPNLQGSYLAACVLYNTLWETRSLGNAYTAGLPAATAQRLQTAADTTVYGSTARWNYEMDSLDAQFTATPVGGSTHTQYNFANTSTAPRGTTYRWSFSDGDSSSSQNVFHRFTGPPPYTATLVVEHCGRRDTATQNLTPLGLHATSEDRIRCYPNPVHDRLVVQGAQLGDQLVVYNSLGQVVARQTVQQPEAEATVAVQTLPQGWYTLVVHSKDGQRPWSGRFKKSE